MLSFYFCYVIFLLSDIMKKRIVSIILIILVLILIYFLIPKIKLDNTEVTLNYNEKYSEGKVTARNVFKDYTKDVKVLGKVDTKKVGKYKINYVLNYGMLIIKKTKTVNVVDKKNPVITLEGNTDITLCPGCKYEEEGFSATDEYDGDLTDKVIKEQLKDKIVYTVEDSSKNKVSVERKIKEEDKEAPIITLKGYENVTIYRGNVYEEEGYTATDNCDGDITSLVEAKGTVDNTKVGVYEITYTVKDKSGNTTSVKRKVSVIYPPSGGGNGYIYLTFDDGPSNLTLDILDILKEEGVKATFFVTGQSDSTNYIIKRAYDEGHTIALHTYSHDYSYVYSSVDNYFADLNKISNKVENIIGKKTNIIRFPGGSSNTVSRNYSIGIMTRLTGEVLNNGYRYFDWNVDADDAGGAYTDSNRIYLNVVNNLSHSKTNVVLMHDSYGHTATRDALRNIIQYGKRNGYKFASIDDSTPSVVHGVNN